MLLEPLPLFDCMYCVKDYKLVFQKMSENYLSKKHGEKSYQNYFNNENILNSSSTFRLLSVERSSD